MKRIITITILCLGAIAMINGQALKVANTGFVGLNTADPSVRLDIPEHNQNDNITEIGSYGIQSFSDNNGFLTHNCSFDLAQSPTGNAMVMRTAGAGSLAQFYDGRILYRTVPSGAAGAVVPYIEAMTIQNRGSVQIGYFYGDDRGANGTMLDVNGNIAVMGVAINSDKRLKKNVSKFDKGLKEVMALNPINYQYNGKGGVSDSKTMHVGIMAQELQKVAPELTNSFNYIEGQEINGMTGKVNKSGTSTEYLRINDTGIKYMLINAIKEQQAIIDQLQKQNEILTESISEIKNLLNQDQSNIDATLEGSSKIASISQNAPNPFKGQTTLEYFIPEGSKKSSVAVFSNNGQLIKTIEINQIGKGTLSLEADQVPTGNYRYVLSIDGVQIDTKTMSIVR